MFREMSQRLSQGAIARSRRPRGFTTQTCRNVSRSMRACKAASSGWHRVAAAAGVGDRGIGRLPGAPHHGTRGRPLASVPAPPSCRRCFRITARPRMAEDRTGPRSGSVGSQEWKSGLNLLRNLGVSVGSVNDGQHVLDNLFSFGPTNWVKEFCDHVCKLQVHWLSQTMLRSHLNAAVADVEAGTGFVYQWLIEECFNQDAVSDSSRKAELLDSMTEEAYSLFQFLDEPRALFREMNLKPHIEIEEDSISSRFLRFGVVAERRQTPGIFMGTSAIFAGFYRVWKAASGRPGPSEDPRLFAVPVECMMEVKARQRLRLVPIDPELPLSVEAQNLADLEPDFYECSHVLSLGTEARYLRKGMIDLKSPIPNPIPYPPSGVAMSLYVMEASKFSKDAMVEIDPFTRAWKEKDEEMGKQMKKVIDLTGRDPPDWKLRDFDMLLTWYGLPNPK